MGSRVRIPAALTSFAPGGYVRARLSDAGVVLSKGDCVTAFDELAEVEVDGFVSGFHGPMAYLQVDWATQREAVLQPPVIKATSVRIAAAIVAGMFDEARRVVSDLIRSDGVRWDGAIAPWQQYAEATARVHGQGPRTRVRVKRVA